MKTNRRREPAPLRDPVVEEIRAIRRNLLREAGGTIDGYFDLLHRKAAARTARANSPSAAPSRAKRKPRRRAA